MAFDDDQHALELAADVSQDLVELGCVVVRKRTPRGTREFDALDDAVVRKSIMQHQIFWAEQIANGADVGGMAADESHAILHAVDLCQSTFQITLDGTLPCYQTAS